MPSRYRFRVQAKCAGGSYVSYYTIAWSPRQAIRYARHAHNEIVEVVNCDIVEFVGSSDGPRQPKQLPLFPRQARKEH